MNCEKIGGLKHCGLHHKNSCYAASIISDQPFALGIPDLLFRIKLLLVYKIILINQIDYY